MYVLIYTDLVMWVLQGTDDRIVPESALHYRMKNKKSDNLRLFFVSEMFQFIQRLVRKLLNREQYLPK